LYLDIKEGEYNRDIGKKVVEAAFELNSEIIGSNAFDTESIERIEYLRAVLREKMGRNTTYAIVSAGVAITGDESDEIAELGIAFINKLRNTFPTHGIFVENPGGGIGFADFDTTVDRNTYLAAMEARLNASKKDKVPPGLIKYPNGTGVNETDMVTQQILDGIVLKAFFTLLGVTPPSISGVINIVKNYRSATSAEENAMLGVPRSRRQQRHTIRDTRQP
jgi:hypothetical protein